MAKSGGELGRGGGGMYRTIFLLSLCAKSCSDSACFKVNCRSLTVALFCFISYCRLASLLFPYIDVDYDKGLLGIGIVYGDGGGLPYSFRCHVLSHPPLLQ